MPGTVPYLGKHTDELDAAYSPPHAVYLGEEQTRAVNSCMTQPHAPELRGAEWCRKKMLGRLS